MENVRNTNLLIQNIEKYIHEAVIELKSNEYECDLLKNNAGENMDRLMHTFNSLCMTLSEKRIMMSGYKYCNICDCMIRDFKRHLMSNKHADNAYTKYRVMNNL